MLLHSPSVAVRGAGIGGPRTCLAGAVLRNREVDLLALVCLTPRCSGCRLSVALQRSIQRDQILRSHLRRGTRGNDAAPDGYYGGCGDGGYESGAASSSSSDGGGGAGGFGGGEHSVIGGGSASCCTGSRLGVPRSAG